MALVCEICGRPCSEGMQACPNCGTRLDLTTDITVASASVEATAESADLCDDNGALDVFLEEARRHKKPWLAFLLTLCLGPLGMFYIGANWGLSALMVWGILAAPAAMWASSWHWMVWLATLLLAVQAASLAGKRNALLYASLLAIGEERPPTADQMKGVFNYWSGPFAISTLAGEFLPNAAFWMVLVEMIHQAIGLFREHAVGAGIAALLLSWLPAAFAAWLYGLMGAILALFGTGIHWLAARLSRQPLWFPDAM